MIKIRPNPGAHKRSFVRPRIRPSQNKGLIRAQTCCQTQRSGNRIVQQRHAPRICARLQKRGSEHPTSDQRPRGRRMQADLRGAGLWQPLGPVRVAPRAQPSASRRRSRRLETRPSLPLTQRPAPHPGEDRGRGSGFPVADRGDRDHDAGRAHDDADAWLLRGVRARHGP